MAREGLLTRLLLLTLACVLVATSTLVADSYPLKRAVADKPVYDAFPHWLNTNQIVVKINDAVGTVELTANRFDRNEPQFNDLNGVLESSAQPLTLKRRLKSDRKLLSDLRTAGSVKAGFRLPDLSLYFQIDIPEDATPAEKLALIEEINAREIVEIAYFAPVPSLPLQPTPSWEPFENYLQAAPMGINAYAAWEAEGGKGEDIMVVDIEGNWVESHEDLRGGTGSFHIAGSKIQDPTWYHHGTAVLGEIAADSNNFGMTGIAFNVDLGTVSIGSLDLADALVEATNATEPGDIILIELQYSGPNGGAYVPAEYYQEYFDAILTASNAGRIVVEAGANGAQDLDDETYYGSLFDPDFRFSGAIMVAASNSNHIPEWFTSYGQRLDVHGFGSNVYTLGYGDLYGTDTTNYYTADFGGTSSASPIIVGACACLQGIHKAVHGTVLDHNEMRALLKDYSTPQASNPKLIGPMPDLAGSVESILGVAFSADTTIGFVPLAVHFDGSSGLLVDTWTWDFGDGDSAFIEDPFHIYDTPGMFDVSLEVNAGGDVRLAEKAAYVVALADTLKADTLEAEAGQPVDFVIYGNNTVPLDVIRIPIEITGSLKPTVSGVSVAGYRTSYFEDVDFQHWDEANGRYTLKLQPSDDGSQPDLGPGSGPIVKITFNIPSSAESGDECTLDFSGYDSYMPGFEGPVAFYAPATRAGKIAIDCVVAGDCDGSGTVNIADLTYLVAYLFSGGSEPTPLLAGDTSCDGGVNIADLTFLVAYLFSGGPAPACGC